MAGGTLPPGMVERARELQEGRAAVAPARDAATIALLRPSPSGPQVYLLRRVRGMAFAGGMHVFPGGSVDEADAQEGALADGAWAGPSPAAWAAQLDCTEPLARALVCAAVRETFEESGVLLAGPSPTDLLADVSTAEWEAERVALEAREQSLSELLARRGLVLRTDLLRPLAHWITPEVEPKRFDTRFFLAELPAGQMCRPVGGEADQRVWVRPADAIAQGLRMMPPTVAVLEDLARFDDVEAALDASRALSPVLPRLVVDAAGEGALLLPGDPGYPGPAAPGRASTAR
jgi:8-oxo-dGTP pyrophosphatase MutT (NUDIX family)